MTAAPSHLPALKTPLPALAALCLALAWGPAHAQAHEHAHTHATPAVHPTAPPAASPGDLAEGEVRRWDARTGKLTLRHGEIKSIGMPPMTMAFTLQDPSLANSLPPGSQVRFRVEEREGARVITHLEAAQ